MSGRVAVIGLGPVGATLALLLRAHGADVLAVERGGPEPFGAPRAVALDDEALRVLAAAGARPPSVRVVPVRLRGRRGDVLVELPPLPSPYGEPSLAFFVQPDLERALRAGLATSGADVRYGVEAVEVGEDGVVLRDLATGRTARESVAWVVGCDGARSAVRRAMGARLRGTSGPRPWLVADTADPPPAQALDPGAFEFVGDPARPWVHGPLPDGRHRFEFLLARGARPEPVAAARALLDAHAGPGPGPEVLRAAVYRFHARVATGWRRGRLLLAGDAAHLAPPFAGQGLSAGLRDAAALGWRLAAVATGGAEERVLDTYARERAPHVAAMTGIALALGAAVQTRSPALAAARDAVVRTLLRSGSVRGWATGGGWKPAARLPPHGALVAPGRLGRAPAGLLLPQPAAPDGRPLDEALGTRARLVTAREAPALAPWLAASGAEAVLVRPDRFVFAAGRADDAAAMTDAWSRALGHGRP